jgi:hypothetical protein
MRFGAGHGVVFLLHGTLTMVRIAPEWLEHQRRRWWRHDAHRFMRPDARADAQEDKYVDPSLASEIEEIRTGLAGIEALRRELRALKFQQLLGDDKAYNPNQPRVPAGNPDGGQWMSAGNQDDETGRFTGNDFDLDELYAEANATGEVPDNGSLRPIETGDGVETPVVQPAPYLLAENGKQSPVYCWNQMLIDFLYCGTVRSRRRAAACRS